MVNQMAANLNVDYTLSKLIFFFRRRSLGDKNLDDMGTLRAANKTTNNSHSKNVTVFSPWVIKVKAIILPSQ